MALPSIFFTDVINKGTHNGKIKRIFLKKFFVSNSTPLEACASIIPDISPAKMGMKRMAVVSVKAYLYGIPSFDTRTLDKSFIWVMDSISASGTVAAKRRRETRNAREIPSDHNVEQLGTE